MHPVRLIYFPIGFLYLWIRYRNREKVAKAKKEYYENSYVTAGATLLLSVIGVLFFVALAAILIIVLYLVFTRPPSAL